MKKFLQKAILGGLATLAGISGCATPPILRPTPYIWNQLQKKETLRHPKEIIHFTNMLAHEDDIFGVWKSARRTIQEGKGDCEDIAFLAAYLAEKHFQYEPTVIAPYNKTKTFGHAFALLTTQKEGKTKYGAIEKKRFFPPTRNSIDEIVIDISNYYKISGEKKWSHYIIIPLKDSEADWRYGWRNLQDHFQPLEENGILKKLIYPK